MNALALPTTVLDIVEEYEAKVAAVDAAIADFKEAHDRMQFATVVHGIYVEKMVDSFYIRPDAIRLNLRKSGWKAVYSRLQIDQLASAKDKRLFTQTLTDPPELTMDNAKATFGDYLLRPRFHRLRAALEPFAEVADGMGWDALQSEELIHVIGPRLSAGCYIEAGTFRRARAALAGE